MERLLPTGILEDVERTLSRGSLSGVLYVKRSYFSSPKQQVSFVSHIPLHFDKSWARIYLSKNKGYV